MITQTKTDRFRDRIQKEVDSAKEKGLMEDWEMYEHLKGFIPSYGVDYEIGIKIITGIADL